MARPHDIISELAGFQPGGKQRVTGVGAGFAGIPEAPGTVPGAPGVPCGQPGAKVVALEFDALGFIRFDLEKILPALLLSRLLEVTTGKAIGQRRIGRSTDEAQGIRRTNLPGLPGELEVVQVDGQGIIFQARAQLLVLGPLSLVDRPHRLIVKLARAGEGVIS